MTTSICIAATLLAVLTIPLLILYLVTETRPQRARRWRRGRARLFRNNVGALRDANGRLIRFGLQPGSGDLIGWRSVVIGSEHLGQRVAQFVSVEVKAPGQARRARPDQLAWQQQVTAAGGLACIVDSEAQAVECVDP